MDVRDEMLGEFRQELAATRRTLERIPEDKLTWKPHEKSTSLGRLAMHIATLPGAIAAISRADRFDILQAKPAPPFPQSNQEISAALDRSVSEVEATLRETTAEAAQAPWTMVKGEQTVFTLPRYRVWRTLLLNHLYHHRAQLTVYLRLLDVPVPAIYGPSADENPFG